MEISSRWQLYRHGCTGGCGMDLHSSQWRQTCRHIDPFVEGWGSIMKHWSIMMITLQWRHNELDGVSNHQLHDCLLNRLFRRRSKKTSKLRVTGLCAGNSPVTGEFPAQIASNAENFPIWWRNHEALWPLILLNMTGSRSSVLKY